MSVPPTSSILGVTLLLLHACCMPAAGFQVQEACPSSMAQVSGWEERLVMAACCMCCTASAGLLLLLMLQVTRVLLFEM